MKKFIMITIISLSLAFLFALSCFAVSGSSSDEFGEITYVDGLRADTTLTDKESRVVLKNTDGTYSTYPTYYICDVKLQWQGTTQYDFSAINSALGTSYDMMSIVRIEIITDATIWNPNGGLLHGNTNLIEVVFPKGTQITEIGGQTFKGCTNLKSINIPKSVKKLGWLCFEHCYGLEEVIFEEGSELTSLGVPSFQRCDSLKEIRLPDSLTSFGWLEFQDCKSLEKVFIGKNFTSAVDEKLFLNTPTKGMQLYLPSCADFQSFIKAAPGATVITSLTKSEAEKIGVGKVYSYDELLTYGPFEESVIVYGCPGCVMLGNGGAHLLESINSCVGKCSECGFVEALENPVHSLKTACIYENGFAKGGIVYESCENDSCGYSKVLKNLGAIVSFIGYSVKENNTAICAGYLIDKQAESLYEQYNAGTKLDYGIYFGIADGNTDNLVSYQNGVIKSNSQGGIAVSLSKGYSAYEFKVSGFNEKTVNTEILLCAFIGNGEKFDYTTSGYGSGVTAVAISKIK